MAAAQPNALKSLRVPLVGGFLNRNGEANTDQRFINCYPESVKAPISDQKKIYLVQRPGITPIATIDTVNEARGLKYWNGKYYTVYGNKLKKTTTAGVTTDLQTLTTSTGECAFEVGTIPEGNVLVLADGDFVYVIETDDTVTQVPLTLMVWQSEHAYSEGDRIRPTVATGYYYEAVSGGESGTTEPTWPIFLGETVSEDQDTYTVASLTITNGGSGYTSAPTITIDPPPSGTTATATCTITDGVVTNVTITNAGTGYTSAPGVTFTAPGTGTTATATSTLSAKLVWEAKGYTNSAGVWQASYAYSVGQQVSVNVGGTEYLFGISIAGTSGSTAPDWSITTGESTVDNDITWTCLGPFKDDAPPKYHKPSLAFMDGYLFLILKKADGSDSADIYNCDVDNPFSWNPINFIVAEQFPDNLQALARQNNMLVAFGDTSTEFFYDAGNASGTPLARNTSYTLQVGIAAPYALYQNEKFCLFIGQSQSGGRAVWMLDGFVPKKVSDEYIERIIDTLTHDEIMNVSGFGLRTNGHLFFVIYLPDFALVYDLEERMWWESTAVDVLQMTDDDSGKAIVQSKTTGKIYYVDPSVGTDDGVPIEMQAYTLKYDFDSMNLKSMQGIHVVCDQVGTNTTMQLRWSDDDYRTWSDWRTLNFNPRAYFSNLGSFRRRAFNLKYSGGLPARFEAFEFDVRLWKA